MPPADTPGAQFDLRGRSVPIANGWQWIVAGWDLFRKQPGMWVLFFVLLLVVFAVLGSIPFLGGAAAALITPVLTGSLMIACRDVDEGRDLKPEDLLAGFRSNLQPLLVVGVFHLVATLIILLLVLMFVGATVGVGALMGASVGFPGTGALAAGVVSLLIAGLIGAALAVPVYAAMWFAPALIVFHDVDAVSALKASFFAILKNIPATFWYGLIVVGLAILAGIPFGLGYFVLAPVAFASVYASYRDIFFVA
ncbi:MAG: DUF2189 domain-containing protein [Betaproteobacteria bacterium]|nr:DUF2189 domain-containing protein [Betaproteobacteria bacterium]